METLLLGLAATLAVTSVVIAYVISRRYSTSDPPRDKLSVFCTVLPGAAPTPARVAPTLSIVIPCYNEEERLPIMLDQTLAFCSETTAACAKLNDAQAARARGLFSDYEIVVVDDCSKDGTVAVFERYKARNLHVKLSLVRVQPNRGKGFAVRSGFLAASGDYVLMADGDGATQIGDVCKLLAALRGGAGSDAPAPAPQAGSKAPFIAVGSRAHLETESIAQRTGIRTLLMKLFHLVVQFTYVCGTRGAVCPIHDTQCGFKLFDRRLCEAVFTNNRLERFAFDVELLIVARRLGLRVVEVPVNWREIPGSKVNLRAMVQMGLDCLLMCFTYGLGMWGVTRR
jgi:dolichyl-phosphate beta-glucosyltransferase